MSAVTIVPNYGTGFEPGTTQRAVFQSQVTSWAAYRTPCTQSVRIDVSMAPLGTYAKALPPYQPGVEYVIGSNPADAGEYTALAVTDNFNSDPDAGCPTSARIRFNSDVLDWYWGTSSPVPSTQFDAMTVACHEIAHAVGFAVSYERFADNVVSGPPRQYDLDCDEHANLTDAAQGTHTDPGMYPDDIMSPELPAGTRRPMSTTVLKVLRHVNSCGADVAMVIDRSGSMGSSGYMDPAKTAAGIFAAFMQDGDGVAVATFCEYSTVNFHFAKIIESSRRAAARSAINGIYSEGTTSMGAGMLTGQTELYEGWTKVPQAMVLLSDGYENTAPWVADILPLIPARTDIYTIALGPDSDQGLLFSIAAVTGGLYFYAPGASGLMNIYNIIRGRATNQQTMGSFSGTIGEGQTVSHEVIVDGLATRTMFFVTFEGSDVDLELVTPSGTLIDSAVAETSASMKYVEGEVFDYFDVESPEAGQWQMKVIGTSLSYPEAYIASVQGASGLTLDAHPCGDSHDVYQPVNLFAKLAANGAPVTGATVTVRIELPSWLPAAGRARHAAREQTGSLTQDEEDSASSGGIASLAVTDSLTLYDDGIHGDSAAGDGIYANYFTNTGTSGSYSFDVTVSGNCDAAGDYSRLGAYSVYIDTTSRPAAPLPVSPENGSSSMSLSRTLTWSASGPGCTYSLQVASDPGFTTLVADESLLSATSYEVGGLEAGTCYAWRVSASDLLGTSDWSPVSYFFAEESLGEIAVSPSPFVPSRGHTKMTFFGPGLYGTEIMVYNKAGDRVRRLTCMSMDNKLEWDGRSDDDKGLASGVYVFYVHKQAARDGRTGKFAIIR
jgi:hypothetical protein